MAGAQLCRARPGEHADRIVCEFSQGEAGRRGERGSVPVEPTTPDDKFGVGKVGDRPVDGGHGVVDALDRGSRGWAGIVGYESGQPAQGVSQQLGLGQFVGPGVFDGVGGVSRVDGGQPIVQRSWGRQVVVDAGGVGPNRVHQAHGRGLIGQQEGRCLVGHAEIL